ncbi:metallophosphoesterase [Deinococcus sp. KNUC1210]|uniref:metallophosphoesterase n=1 Tax=Deinococcus sp. KNUC1210 TaxID=2917691 RepID=UPI001EF0AA54|nr:metallophosphoesterase [Deinococcus sp. KNUC1210]ULH15338.1 metallophosphoesterase [Deinococcus sp. KNUC1210]
MRCKFIAIGDVHADFERLWEALRAASCVDAAGMPTLPVCSGLYQVVLIGDLVHPKTEAEYARLIGSDTFDSSDPEQLFLAAREQVKRLERLYAYQRAAPRSVHILLGNHDDAVLHTDYLLGTVGGLSHVEFDASRGGVLLPDHLRAWFQSFLRELRVGGLHFAHVGPLPAMTSYDDLFYADHVHKRWWQETPEYVQMAGIDFGVYGHTQMKDGIMINRTNGFAMIDALPTREYLEVLVDTSSVDEPLSVRPVPF